MTAGWTLQDTWGRNKLDVIHRLSEAMDDCLKKKVRCKATLRVLGCATGLAGLLLYGAFALKQTSHQANQATTVKIAFGPGTEA
eukprot:1151756-Pelagomonas_calceolata.AAC.2